MRLCKDCKHYRRFLWFDPTCAVAHKSPSSHTRRIYDKVDGRYLGSMGTNRCVALRVGWEKDDCGPDGQYWESR